MPRKRFEPGQAVEVRATASSPWFNATVQGEHSKPGWFWIADRVGWAIPFPTRRIRPRKTERR